MCWKWGGLRVGGVESWCVGVGEGRYARKEVTKSSPLFRFLMYQPK